MSSIFAVLKTPCFLNFLGGDLELVQCLKSVESKKLKVCIVWAVCMFFFGGGGFFLT